MRPIPFSSFGGYRRFCWPWWKDLWRMITVGWLYDLRAYWHRARYGWAPRDTWSLDMYLAQVLAGSLAHLASKQNGSPGCYPYVVPHVVDKSTGEVRAMTDADGPDDVICDHDLWDADLRRWAAAFGDYVRDDYYDLHGRDFAAWQADEAARGKALHAALRELEPWWEALWD